VRACNFTGGALNKPELALERAAQLHPKIDDFTARPIDVSGSLAERKDEWVGLNDQPSALGIVATQTQTPPQLGTEDLDTPASRWAGKTHRAGIRF
jgi:hypothetical protein